MNRVIFLDFDGVLNDPKYLMFTERKTSLDDFDPHRVAILSNLCSRTKAKVVLTSTWRDDIDARRYLKKCGIPIIGATPHGKNRGQEIHQWIIDKKFDGQYIILDDECSDLYESQKQRLVYTREGADLGLTMKHTIFADALFRDVSPDSQADEEFLDCILEFIESEWLRVMWNIYQKEFDDENPWRNTGNVEGYKNGTFEVHAYDWGWDYDDETDKPQPVNFKWKDLEVTWYKWCGRGLSTNRPTTHDELALMLHECLESLRKEEEIHCEY